MSQAYGMSPSQGSNSSTSWVYRTDLRTISQAFDPLTFLSPLASLSLSLFTFSIFKKKKSEPSYLKPHSLLHLNISSPIESFDIYMWWWACHFLFDSPSGVCPDAFWVYMPLRLMGMMIDVRLIHEAQRSIMRSTHRFDWQVVCFWRQWIGPMISPILKFNLNLHSD